MLFDTHAHLNFKDYDKDRDMVIENSLKERIFMINIGTDLKESKKVVEISKNYEEGVYASIGLHPLHIKEEDFGSNLFEYEKLLEESTVVAIGETGIDREGEDEERQKEVFLEHIRLSKKTNLPLIIHCRKAHKELIEILKSQFESSEENSIEKIPARGVVHCFTGSKKEAEEYVRLGFYLGINGIIFKMNLEETIKEISLEKILLETDCPFLTPLPEKGRNEPIFTKHIAKEIARIKKVSVEEVARITTKNAKELFNV